MERGAKKDQRRLIELTLSALADLLAIYMYTAQQWGEAQAEEYQGFLNETIQEIADNPEDAPLVQNMRDMRSKVARWKNARQGHRIFYRPTHEGISVLRLLHTAMNWPDHINFVSNKSQPSV